MKFARLFTQRGGAVVAAVAALTVALLALAGGCAAQFFLMPPPRPAGVTAGPAPTEGRGTARPTNTPTPTTPPADDGDEGEEDPGMSDVVPSGSASDYQACGEAAARFAVAYRASEGDTAAVWATRIGPLLTTRARTALASVPDAFDPNQLPAGDVTDAAAQIIGDECLASVTYADGSTIGPTLIREPSGWVVDEMGAWHLSGGQAPRVTAPGPNEMGQGR